jgi:hypothetical protein
MPTPPCKFSTSSTFRDEEVDILHHVLNGLLMGNTHDRTYANKPAFRVVMQKVQAMKQRVEDDRLKQSAA